MLREIPLKIKAIEGGNSQDQRQWKLELFVPLDFSCDKQANPKNQRKGKKIIDVVINPRGEGLTRLLKQIDDCSNTQGTIKERFSHRFRYTVFVLDEVLKQRSSQSDRQFQLQFPQ